MTLHRALACCFFLASAGAALAAESPFDAVARMVEANQLAPAEEELRRLLAEHDDPAARDFLGVVLSRQGRYQEAEEQFKKALAAEPDLQAARQHLARLYLLGQREADAVEELRAAARLGPLERDLALKLAVVEMAAGRPAAAESQWSSVAERFDSVQALVYLARSRSGRADLRGAMEALRRALEIAPNSEEVLGAYARAALDAGEFVTSILALDPLTRMHPKVAEYAYLLGLARLKVGDTSGALEALLEARALEPHRVSTLLVLGLAWNAQKRFSEAQQVLTEALRLEPDGVETLAALAEAEEGLTQLERAEEYVSRVLAKHPDHLTGNLVLGTLRMKQGRYGEAREALKKAVAADPGSPKAHYQLSLAYARLGDRESSRRHRELYQKALRSFEESLTELGPEGGGARP